MIDTKISKIVVSPEVANESSSARKNKVEYQQISEHNLITEQDQEN